LLHELVLCQNFEPISNLVDNIVYGGFDHFQLKSYSQMLLQKQPQFILSNQQSMF